MELKSLFLPASSVGENPCEVSPGRAKPDRLGFDRCFMREVNATGGREGGAAGMSHCHRHYDKITQEEVTVAESERRAGRG